MKSIKIDIADQTVTVDDGANTAIMPLGSAQAFAQVSKAWLRCGWDVKHVYSFAWLGRPIIQLPEDMLRLQELIYRVKPDVIVETGIAHGGSLIFYASLCKSMEKGRVIGIDLEIRPHNRKAIEAHQLKPLITLIEGDSVAPDTLAKVKAELKPEERVLVILDSCHTKEHVLAELKAYSPLVSVGSYMIAMDGIMQDVVGAPRTAADWNWNNPQQAVAEFLQTEKNFVIEKAKFEFNEGIVEDWITYAPQGILLKTRA